MTKEMETRLGELLQDENFFAKLNECEDREAIRVLLSENGVEMTVDEIAADKEAGKLALVEEGYITEDEELTEKALEAVSGGRFIMYNPMIPVEPLAKLAYYSVRVRFGRVMKVIDYFRKK